MYPSQKLWVSSLWWTAWGLPPLTPVARLPHKVAGQHGLLWHVSPEKGPRKPHPKHLALWPLILGPWGGSKERIRSGAPQPSGPYHTLNGGQDPPAPSQLRAHQQAPSLKVWKYLYGRQSSGHEKANSIKFSLNPHPRTYLLILERGEERGERGRETSMGCLSYAPRRDGTCGLGMRPDWGSNQ